MFFYNCKGVYMCWKCSWAINQPTFLLCRALTGTTDVKWQCCCDWFSLIFNREGDQWEPREMLCKRTVKHVNLNKEDAVDRSRWRKMIKDVRWSGWVWVGECFFWYQYTRVGRDKRPLNGCVRVCVCSTEEMVCCNLPSSRQYLRYDDCSYEGG